MGVPATGKENYAETTPSECLEDDGTTVPFRKNAFDATCESTVKSYQKITFWFVDAAYLVGVILAEGTTDMQITATIGAIVSGGLFLFWLYLAYLNCRGGHESTG